MGTEFFIAIGVFPVELSNNKYQNGTAKVAKKAFNMGGLEPSMLPW